MAPWAVQRDQSERPCGHPADQDDRGGEVALQGQLEPGERLAKLPGRSGAGETSSP